MGPDNGASPHEHPNQFALLRQRRFAPFFWTQFSGAANDNLFKFAFTVMVTYQLSVSWLPPAMASRSTSAGSPSSSGSGRQRSTNAPPTNLPDVGAPAHLAGSFTYIARR